MSYIVALTGGIGSGKTTVANEFAKLGIPVVDADEIARQIVLPGMPALQSIQKHYGESILNKDGSLNRKALRQHIFNDHNEKQWLNNLLHPLIQQETIIQLAKLEAPYILWVVPLLIENNLMHFADRTLVIDVTPKLQLERTIQRDNINHELAQQMLNSQVHRQQRLAHADDIIDNSGAADQLPLQVALLHERYLKLATEKDDQNNST